MPDHEAKDYQANGPTDIGFRTHGTQIENGVVASGTKLGVHGIGVGDEGTTAIADGVRGESHAGGSGVVGIGPEAGVRGESEKGGDGVRGFSEEGVGVRGESNTNDGVVGTSRGQRGEGTSGVFGFNTRRTGAAFGVRGESESPDGAGIRGFSKEGVGVKGESNTNDGVVGVTRSSNAPDGAGIRGISASGYGGHFEGGRAPLRLVPADTPGPPTNGNHERGELFIDSDGSLFFCNDSGTPGNPAGNWSRVRHIGIHHWQPNEITRRRPIANLECEVGSSLSRPPFDVDGIRCDDFRRGKIQQQVTGYPFARMNVAKVPTPLHEGGREKVHKVRERRRGKLREMQG
jgi:hypothetical protein